MHTAQVLAGGNSYGQDAALQSSSTCRECGRERMHDRARVKQLASGPGRLSGCAWCTSQARSDPAGSAGPGPGRTAPLMANRSAQLMGSPGSTFSITCLAACARAAPPGFHT